MDTKVLTAIPDDDANRTAFWQQHIDAWRKTTLTQRGYAKQHGLSIARFTYWKSKFYRNAPVTKKDFVPVRVTEPQGPIRFMHPSGVVIECSTGTEVTWLRSLLGLEDAS